ncbi:helix-turn-helix domain-containing protein [Hoeflea sp.]|uniref:helix-turn-helix domain-containing protein n=1 Tax=Hoeflea sp. TaxID=1940281 RepID=UPI0019997B39|nr:helix-turn-helix domain-containing protein [Hoeflea sp.]MBC7283300.1 helix-turn-helix domain-containing protein [Hoeflea sp.]
MKLLDIGEVSSRSGIAPSALRHYEAVGLIASASRHGLRRQFPPEVLLQLKLIAMAKSAGFSLADISRMFGRDGMPHVPREAFHAKAEELDLQVQELMALRDMLRHVAGCPAQSHIECPKFRQLIEAAGKGVRRHKTVPRLD